MVIGKTDETPEEDFDSIDDMFKRFHEEDSQWKKKHPIRGYIRDLLDKIFPNGIADGYRAYYILQRPWKILRYWKDEIEYAHQRVFRGWDDKAIWSMDYYLSRTIGEMVRELQRIKIGVPLDMFEGLPYEDEENYRYSEESEKIAEERWDKILNDIAEGFEGYAKIDDLETYEEMELAYKKFFDETFELFKKYYRSLWW